MVDTTFPTDTDPLTADTLESGDLLPVADVSESGGDLKEIRADHLGTWAKRNTPRENVFLNGDYTLEIGDANKNLDIAAASEVLITVPTNAAVPYPDGTEFIINQLGAGGVRLVGASGVVLNTPDNLLLDTQYSMGVLRYVGIITDAWQFVRFWLTTEATPPPVAGDPDVNTPKGHVIGIEMRSPSKTNADRDAEQLDAMTSLTDLAMVSRRWFWSDIDTGSSGSAVYDWTDVKFACQLASDNGQRLLVFPMWRSFNSIEPTPPWLVTLGFQSGSSGEWDANMWELTCSDAFEAMIVDLATELNGYPGFAGVVMSETSQKPTLTTPECDQWIVNLVSIYETICIQMPDYNHFMFMNFLSDGSTRTGEFFDIITDVRATLGALSPPQNNMILSGPDLFPYAKSLSEAPTGTYETDRIYNVFQRIHAAFPDQRLSHSMQFDSYRIDPGNESKAWKFCWPIPTGTLTHPGIWPMRDLFKFAREEIGVEWMLWNWAQFGTQKTIPDAQLVFTEFPTWERAVNLIDPAIEKLLNDSFWTLSPAGDSLAEDTSNKDSEYNVRAGISSYTWTEDSNTAVRKLECTIPLEDLEEDKLYTMQTMVYDMGIEADRNFRLEARLCDGTTVLGSTWVADDDTWTSKTMDDQRSQPAYASGQGFLQYYRLQVDFTPRFNVDVSDLILRFKLMDGTTSSFAGGNAATYKIGRCKIFPA